LSYAYPSGAGDDRINHAPDPWETGALKAFEDGQEEVSAVETVNGQEYLRLMRPLITIDRAQLDQIILNLATNARDAMPGGGRITITTRPIDIDEDFVKTHGLGQPGDFVHMSITDSGTGMDSVTREKIFEPFFTTKETGKGTGLGLAIIYGIVKQHDGEAAIRLFSENPDSITLVILDMTMPGSVHEH